MSAQTSAFVFRQFKLAQGSGSWKVGTDSVLLGSWCNVGAATRAMDLGTGSGVLSLMLAQRNGAILVDAIEISTDAIAEATENIRNSKWADRIHVIHADVMQLDPGAERTYDLIVCNPPFFPAGLLSPSEVRRTSRQGQGFSLYDVPSVAEKYLRSDGILAVVIPVQLAYQFIQASNTCGLYVHRRLEVRHHAGALASIALLELGRQLIEPEHHTILLYQDQKPSTAYQRLCEHFITV